MENLKIREAELKDAENIAVIHVRAWQQAYRGQMPNQYLDQLSVEKKIEVWKRTLQDPKEGLKVFVGETESKITGWCVVNKNRDEDVSADVGELGAINIDPDFMGQGVGSKLLEYSLKYLKDEGYKQATLWVIDTNKNARSFYEKRGWALEGKDREDKRDTFILHELRYIIHL